jgi:hypothetical protein
VEEGGGRRERGEVELLKTWFQKFSKVCSPTKGDYKIGYDTFLEQHDEERSENVAGSDQYRHNGAEQRWERANMSSTRKCPTNLPPTRTPPQKGPPESHLWNQTMISRQLHLSPNRDEVVLSEPLQNDTAGDVLKPVYSLEGPPRGFCCLPGVS